jgi:hypothetical protein
MTSTASEVRPRRRVIDRIIRAAVLILLEGRDWIDAGCAPRGHRCGQQA